jgi:dTDP-glucose 4,6-dehydratase
MISNKTIFVTGGAGFIGGEVIRYLIKNTENTVINIDKLTYAGNLDSLKEASTNARYFFEHADICDRQRIASIYKKYRPNAVLHLAAESHVDRSIDGPAEFLKTNINGTFVMLNEGKNYFLTLDNKQKKQFRFLHISTDEVYGSLGESGLFRENSPYRPNSPYSASKASSDHMVRAWFHTYGFPALITNCSNNYGPFQFPEKLIPVIILNALKRKPLPVYGEGKNVRDWLYVEDHARALLTVLEKGNLGETYLVGGHNERQNIEVVNTICSILDEEAPENRPGNSYKELITFVKDRPGHDMRYAIDPTKLESSLGWKAATSFEDGIRKTVQWYLENEEWWQNILSGAYQLNRIGLGK